MAAVYAYVIILTFIGPEMRGKDLSVNADADAAEVMHQRGHDNPAESHMNGSGSDEEDKAVRKEKENV